MQSGLSRRVASIQHTTSWVTPLLASRWLVGNVQTNNNAQRRRKSTSTRVIEGETHAIDGLVAAKQRRGLLYVPGSDERKLRKAFRTSADAICFDLEDSVATDRKAGARETVLYALSAADGAAERLVRINSPSSGLAQDDLEIILSSPTLQGIVIPKVHSPSDVHFVIDMIQKHAHPDTRDSLKLIASIESAKAIMNLKEIATASDQLDSLLFAAEDFCADTGIVRTADRRELLYARSAVVVAAKAYGLSAIDLVCIHYLDQASLIEECAEGHKLGFDAKQMIHPAQIDAVQAAFAPSQQAIEKAQAILAQYKTAIEGGKGAYGLAATKGAKAEMIDAPMILQAQRVLAKAAQQRTSLVRHS